MLLNLVKAALDWVGMSYRLVTFMPTVSLTKTVIITKNIGHIRQYHLIHGFVPNLSCDMTLLAFDLSDVNERNTRNTNSLNVYNI